MDDEDQPVRSATAPLFRTAALVGYPVRVIERATDGITRTLDFVSGDSAEVGNGGDGDDGPTSDRILISFASNLAASNLLSAASSINLAASAVRSFAAKRRTRTNDSSSSAVRPSVFVTRCRLRLSFRRLCR
jgi:hypothetical protein